MRWPSILADDYRPPMKRSDMQEIDPAPTHEDFKKHRERVVSVIDKLRERVLTIERMLKLTQSEGMPECNILEEYNEATMHLFGERICHRALTLGAETNRTGIGQTKTHTFEMRNPWGIDLKVAITFTATPKREATTTTTGQ